MLEVIAPILKSGIKISLSFAAGLILLEAFDAQKLKKYLWQGLAGSFIAGFSIAYPLKFFQVREEFDAVLASLTLVLCLAVFIFTRKAKAFGFLAKALFFSIGFLLPLQDFVEIALLPKTIFVTAKTYLDTELILKVCAGVLSAGMSIFIGVLFTRISRFLDKKKTLPLLLIFFLSVAAHSLIIIASSLLLLGFLPSTTKTVAIVAPLINYKPLTFYALLFMVGIGLVFARTHREDGNHNNLFKLNPAERRKMKADVLIRNRWIKFGYLSLAIVIACIALNNAWANRKIALSPAEKIIPQDGLVYIQVGAVNDGNLHRFYLATEGEIEVRFIVVKKREGVFGVGFDACEICGPRGYYQRNKGEIVCLACDVVMNLDTIGLAGGCNPIPLPYRKEKDLLLIRVSDIEAKKEKFRK